MRKAEKDLLALDRVFKALAHPSRRQILLIIQFRSGEMTAGQIAKRFSHSWPTTTRHLKVLQEAELLTVESEGRERIYRINHKRLARIQTGFLKWFEVT